VTIPKAKRDRLREDASGPGWLETYETGQLVVAVLDEIDRMERGIAAVVEDIRKADDFGTDVYADALAALLR
jgi:hypothetical protein